MSHGATDADLSLAAGTRLRDCLCEAGARVDWVSFDDGHEIPLVVWRAFRKLLLSLR
jgi:predicted esterase